MMPSTSERERRRTKESPGSREGDALRQFVTSRISIEEEPQTATAAITVEIPDNIEVQEARAVRPGDYVEITPLEEQNGAFKAAVEDKYIAYLQNSEEPPTLPPEVFAIAPNRELYKSVVGAEPGSRIRIGSAVKRNLQHFEIGRFSENLSDLLPPSQE